MNTANDDIKYLEEHLGLKNTKKSCDIFLRKQEIKRKLKEKYYLNFPLSNVNGEKKYHGIYQYNYEYQRFDSSIVYDEFMKKFYDLNNVHSKVIFANSGMGSITSFLYSIYHVTNYTFAYKNDIYFETQKLIKIIFKNRLNNKKILLLDTISVDFEFKLENINKYNIIVIDTTCFHAHDFKEMIDYILSKNKICIILRSHTKLDMLGLEYSTLGSAAYLVPPKITSRKMKLLKKIIKFNIEFIANSGLGVTENNVFPLLNHEKMISLNKDRIQRVVQNNKYFYDNMLMDILIKPNHSLFTYVKIKNNKTIVEITEGLKEFCINNQSICKFSPSFGFDYIALDTYYDYHFLAYTIRISIGDVDKKTIDNFILLFQEYIYDLF